MLQAQYSQNPFFGMEIPQGTFNSSTVNLPTESEPSYCLCGQPYNSDIFMIQCDSCKDWFHSTCCNFREWEAIEIDKYHCPRCSPIIGPSINKVTHNSHRHEYWDSNASSKPVQTGTPAFIQELRTRHFTPADDILVKVSGYELTEEYFRSKGFNSPIIINSKEGLDMIMPPENFSYIDVLKLVGDDKEIDVIDVCRQANIRMTLGDFINYVASSGRKRIFNVVSLEFSNTGMTHIIEPPLIARKLDWANSVWPENLEGRPQVQKYCLMSVKDSYTDFHIDFGGTSVWYHVLRGEKVFFFVKPTAANLTLYSQWMTSTNQSETFFGDQVDQCYKFHLRQGQTMLIPTGWIHAVYTPVDSLVFGGNFLHSYNINMQLNCYEIEKKTKTERKYLYPSFITINFFAATKLLEEVIKLNVSGGSGAPETLLVGLKALQQAIKQWNNEKDYNASMREQLPYGINISKLLKDIGKEIRHAERIINHLNPPKPERESKRKRKKPVNTDFVDYSLSPKGFSFDYMPLPSAAYNPSPPTYSKTTTNNTDLKVTLPKPATFPYDRSVSNSHDPNQTVFNSQPLPSMDNSHLWNVPFERPQETVAEYKGGTVLKFKLGAKDLISPAIVQNGVNIPGNPYDDAFENKDVYDFHDDSERDEDCFNFTIDENPKRKKGRIKTKLPVSKQSKNHKIPVNLSTNGIESLLQASLSVPSHGGTSPSTSEAIAGMLSISQNWTPTSKSRQYHKSPEEDVSNVHQDEDYIYPSLDNSDDEDIHIFKPRGRTKVDEAWNPKARVGPLLPKMNRPAREGTKKQAVEKVLEAAAARRCIDSSDKSFLPSSKRQYRRKKSKPKIEIRNPSSQTPGSHLLQPGSSLPGCPTLNKTPSSLSSSSSGPSTPATSKPRKGMKTVKQRLGKILKIHKMIH
ncbi:histone lysine demethylase PHF8 isoform X2 [Dendroctonus ponderosae]|uniref:[Histone H3]-dimethyl-L-lysine(36) demethylase n=1 Tax=Dendroctonus ponderosae TaxID=77166 RepID=A0AAR5PHC7_DENPD|nr:histone lysine demethylase PHF8 isoform X2 [Dendroctonus ponderosae]